MRPFTGIPHRRRAGVLTTPIPIGAAMCTTGTCGMGKSRLAIIRSISSGSVRNLGSSRFHV